jgi:hypothetical protein
LIFQLKYAGEAEFTYWLGWSGFGLGNCRASVRFTAEAWSLYLYHLLECNFGPIKSAIEKLQWVKRPGRDANLHRVL